MMNLQEINQKIKELQDCQTTALMEDNDKEYERLKEELDELYSLKRKMPPNVPRKENKKSTTISVPKQVLEKKEQNKWVYEKHDKDINPNQWIIETERKGGNSEKESFEAFKELKQALYRRKEGQCLLALVDYFGENQHHFRLVLYAVKFEELYGFSKSSYSDSLDALLFYGILEPTWRVRIGPNGGKGRVMVFHTDFSIEELSKKEKYNPKKEEHKRAVRDLKKKWELIRKG